jgi:hypothetical protein
MTVITPHYTAATPLESEEWQGVTLELMGDIAATGMVRYRFLLAVRGPADGQLLWVSAERSRLVRSGASHGFYLGLFAQGGHMNLGQSKDWSDKRLFLLKAMTLVREQLSRTVASWPVTRMEKEALRALWEESAGTRSKTRLREYLRTYDAALPPMQSRRPRAAS